MSSQTTLTGSCDSSSLLRSNYTDEQWNAYANQHSDYEGQLGNGRDIPTVLESDDSEERCPWCGNWYSNVGSHWSRGSCNHSPISQYKMELLKGMCAGDGSVNEDGKNPRMDFEMINKTFLQWLQTEFGWLSGVLSLKKTASKSAKNNRNRDFSPDADESDYADTYRFYTKSHPQLQQFANWYHDRVGIVFPEDLFVTSTSLKMWYVSDGSISWDSKYSSIKIFSVNESDRPEAIVNALEEHGFTVGHSGAHFRLSTEDTEDFFDLIGDPVPGFEYKWAWQDKERYKRLKEQCREKHCTQTLE